MGRRKTELEISLEKAFRREQKRERRKRAKGLSEQMRKSGRRAKFGPAMKPAPVAVKQIDGAVVRVVDQDRFKDRKAASWIEKAAQDLGFTDYAAYLHSPHWRSIRLQVLNRDKWRCCRCGSKRNLQVHHQRYRLGEESLDDLKTLCFGCHGAIHVR